MISWAQATPSSSLSAPVTSAPASGLASRQAVLVLTGDPRRGGNVFDLEVAAIDRARPVVLHVSAHNGCGGVVLSSHGREHIADPVEVADAIDRADHRPTCIVLGFCGSDLIACQVARTTPAVISWPGGVSDEQGTYFADEFYRQLVMRGSLGRAFREGCVMVNSRCVGIAAPVLRSRWHGPLL